MYLIYACAEEAWAVNDHPNMLFIFYEDLDSPLNTEQEDRLVEQSSQ